MVKESNELRCGVRSFPPKRKYPKIKCVGRAATELADWLMKDVRIAMTTFWKVLQVGVL